MRLIGLLNYGDDERQPFLGYSLSQSRPYSEETASRIDTEVKRIVDEAHKTAHALLSQHHEELDHLANELLSEEIVDGERVLEIAGVDSANKRPNVIAFAKNEAIDQEDTATEESVSDDPNVEEVR